MIARLYLFIYWKFIFVGLFLYYHILWKEKICDLGNERVVGNEEKIDTEIVVIAYEFRFDEEW